MFERILSDPQFARYQPKALSRPTNQTVDDAPWLLILDNVLTPEECDVLIAQGAALGYKPSSEVGHTKRFDGKRESVRSERRTSSTTWCKKECADHPVAMAVHDRMEALTGITQQNYEYLQILKYVRARAALKRISPFVVLTTPFYIHTAKIRSRRKVHTAP